MGNLHQGFVSHPLLILEADQTQLGGQLAHQVNHLLCGLQLNRLPLAAAGNFARVNLHGLIVRHGRRKNPKPIIPLLQQRQHPIAIVVIGRCNGVGDPVRWRGAARPMHQMHLGSPEIEFFGDFNPQLPREAVGNSTNGIQGNRRWPTGHHHRHTVQGRSTQHPTDLHHKGLRIGQIVLAIGAAGLNHPYPNRSQGLQRIRQEGVVHRAMHRRSHQHLRAARLHAPNGRSQGRRHHAIGNPQPHFINRVVGGGGH